MLLSDDTTTLPSALLARKDDARGLYKAMRLIDLPMYSLQSR